jgi:hypothetical protein
MAENKKKKVSANRAAKYVNYRAAGRREANKAVKLIRHFGQHGDDQCALAAFNRLPPVIQAMGQKILRALRDQGRVQRAAAGC